MKWSVFGWIAAAMVVVVGGAYAWFWLAGGSGEPSTELTTPTIAAAETTLDTAASTLSATDASSTTEGQPAGPLAFVLDSTRSLAIFELDEELRGSPMRVVGTTDQVAGQILIDTADLSTIEFSEIVINARTFETGSGQRDRAIRGPVILNSASDEFEFITFSVSSVDGLPAGAVPGDTIAFSITGDLTVRGVTSAETFDVSATLVDSSTIEGSANTSISRDVYGIGIPNVPSVANVSDEVSLKLEFIFVAS